MDSVLGKDAEGEIRSTHRPDALSGISANRTASCPNAFLRALSLHAGPSRPGTFPFLKFEKK